MGSSKNFWNNFEAQAGKQSTLWLQWGISTWELVLCAARTRFPETQICCSCLVQDSQDQKSGYLLEQRRAGNWWWSGRAAALGSIFPHLYLTLPHQVFSILFTISLLLCGEASPAFSTLSGAWFVIPSSDLPVALAYHGSSRPSHQGFLLTSSRILSTSLPFLKGSHCWAQLIFSKHRL